MYPAPRLFWQMFKHRNDPPLAATGVHVSSHICLPWDIDMWMELNNGRTLTLFDLGRIPLAQRIGLIDAIKPQGWGLAVAGASVRYRRRIRMFERITMRSRVVFWDDRFVYIEQSMWKPDGDCANHILLRIAVTGKAGIVPPDRVFEVMGQKAPVPEAPEWVSAWIAAEAQRPWPPAQE